MPAPVLAALHDDWTRSAAAARPQLSAWLSREPALAGVADLEDVLARVRARPDETLAALLRLGQAGDQLALRTVVQALLPVALRLTRGRSDLIPEAVSELWLAAAEYPLARRPKSIAANLAWTLRRWAARTGGHPEIPRAGIEPAVRPEPAVPETNACDLLAEARRLGLIDAGTHRTLWTVYIAGLNSSQAATVLETTPELVRYRCSRALRRLRQHAGLLAA